jgi:hypothetical protein
MPKLAKIRAIGLEMERLIESGKWTEAEFTRLRREAHEILPEHADAHGFLLRHANPEWLGPAYRVKESNPLTMTTVQLKSYYLFAYCLHGDSVIEWFPDEASAKERQRLAPSDDNDTCIQCEQGVELPNGQVYILGKEITQHLDNLKLRKSALSKLTYDEKRVLGLE